MVCAWCQRPIDPGQKYSVIYPIPIGNLFIPGTPVAMHRTCLHHYESRVLWEAKRRNPCSRERNDDRQSYGLP